MEQQSFANQMMSHFDSALTYRLITVIELIERENDPSQIPFYDALNVALSYMLDPEHLVELSTRDIPKEWLETVANA